MTGTRCIAENERLRIAFQLDLCEREFARLQQVTNRLFAEPVTGERLQGLDHDAALSEQLDAFSARFGRLQDALGEKLLPAYFRAEEEPERAMRDLLDRAERLELVTSADQWVRARQLRNRLVHEYVRDRRALATNLNEAHALIGLLENTLGALRRVLKPYLDREPF